MKLKDIVFVVDGKSITQGKITEILKSDWHTAYKLDSSPDYHEYVYKDIDEAKAMATAEVIRESGIVDTLQEIEDGLTVTYSNGSKQKSEAEAKAIKKVKDAQLKASIATVSKSVRGYKL